MAERQEEEEDEYEKQKGACEALITALVGKKYFNIVQNINTDKDEQWNSGWQKLVYKDLPLNDKTEDYKKTMWEEYAMSQARNALNRRRQNTTSIFKKKFKGTPMR